MAQKFISIVVLMTLLSGCAPLAPDYQRPPAPVPATWGHAPDTKPDTFDATEVPWREFITEPQLRQVLELALTNNRDLRSAVLNIERARALYQVRRADLLPQVDASATGSTRRVPADLSTTGSAQTQHQYNIGLGISSYELDLFGRVRNLKEQALEQYLTTTEARRSVQISLVAQVASSWLTLAANREQLQLARETLSNEQHAYQLVEKRFNAGVTTGLDLQQAKTSVAAAQVARANFTNLVAQYENRLRLLVGADLQQDLLPISLPQSLTAVSLLLPGLPSDVLLNRPDILAAEHRLRGANANIGAARANFFPRITLVSSVGTGSDQLSGLFQSGSWAWNFAPAVTLPLFNAGRNKATLEVAEVDRNLAVTSYEQAIQVAFFEVADALSRQATINDQIAAQQALTEASAQSYRLSAARYQKGIDNYLNVLDSQRSLFQARQNLINLRLTRLTNLVTLYKALGGGGEQPPAG